MKMTIEELLETIAAGETVPEDTTVSDLKDRKVSFREAVKLSNHGFTVPEENIRYDDEEVAYDPDFDEVVWEENYQPMAAAMPEKISVDLTIEDTEVRQWWMENASKMQSVLEKLVVDLYQTEKILRS